MKYETIEEILHIAKSAEGTTFNRYDVHNRLASKGNKGGLGQIIEEGLFKYDINSNSEADFFNLGVELKVTPLKLNKKNELTAKERLVLNIINYMEEYKYTFETSSFWRKNEKILLMFYLWQEGVERGNYQILKSCLHTFSEEDLVIIQRDWYTIVEKIKSGRAEDISESDTMYLAACTKGANKDSLREQPFSPVRAKQRAFSLKPSYVTGYVRKALFNQGSVALSTADELRRASIEEILEEKFKPYYGMSVQDIANILGYQINEHNKSEIAHITSLILGIRGTQIEDIDEFSKANVRFKTIRLEPNGVPREHMSFEQINFNRLVEADWEDSQFYEKFENTKFLFVVFEYKEPATHQQRFLYLKKVMLWNMPETTIQTAVRKLWEDTRQRVLAGVQLEQTPRGVKNNLPSARENEVCHIRPKAINADDKVMLPDGTMITKQCYWLNREYIAKIIK